MMSKPLYIEKSTLFEKPDEKDGFHYASCYLPKYEWSDIFGFTEIGGDFYDVSVSYS